MNRLLIENHDGQVRTAITVQNKLKEIYIDPAENASLVGQVILGRLDAILPGQFAFVDIGTSKSALMNTSRDVPLKKGQPILVQVYKDPTGSKGAYVGMELRLKGRYVVLMESQRSEIGVSQKITSDSERKRLRAAAINALPKGFGVIVRTSAEGQEPTKISSEIEALTLVYKKVQARAAHSTFPALIYPETPSLVGRVATLLGDLVSADLSEIWVSGFDINEIRQVIASIMPGLEGRVHEHETGLFAAHNIHAQISAALKKTVQLPCGGFITIEQTEACVVIDVNTGRFTGQKDLRSTILETNMQAAICIAWQVALRNLSGMIIVDFIDMTREEDKSALLGALESEIKKDRIKTELVGITELGLVQLTRQRTREPLARLLEKDCPACGGKGRVAILNL
ncbi:MAG: ribonuclease E/G [Defluviitaleaceae bacterium]|nr:ribonuclease E/G [Defluviitaleaceae bacterium]